MKKNKIEGTPILKLAMVKRLLVKKFLHMLSFDNFVKSMPSSLLELKVTPSFCFAFKIPDYVTVTSMYCSQKLGEDFAKFLWPSQNI